LTARRFIEPNDVVGAGQKRSPLIGGFDRKPLALDFTREFLPDDFDDVRQFFSRRGAYAKFKDLLRRRGSLDQWYDFEAKAEERALREWCELNSIEASDE
jgi:hypothetical protein